MLHATLLQDQVIDRQALDRNTMGNAALQQELFILFFDQMPVYLDQLDDAIVSGDTAAWRMAAHGIKGSARALGFVWIAGLSRECEVGGANAELLKALREAIEVTRMNLDQTAAA